MRQSQVSPPHSESDKRDHERKASPADDRVTTPRVRPAQPAQPSGQRKSTPPGALPPQREPALSPNASGSSSASAASAASAAAGGGGGGVAAPADKKPPKNSADNKEKDKWVESVDYAYEYVPVSQKREGRKNM